MYTKNGTVFLHNDILAFENGCQKFIVIDVVYPSEKMSC